MRNPMVSVIIPFYNGLDWLTQAVDSVLNQTYKDFEIIIINDGSLEDITKFLEDYDEKVVIINKKNEGPASARNTGINNARGKYIAFLDSDDLWEKEKLHFQIQYMEDSSAIWSQTQLKYFGENITEKIVDTSIYPDIVFPLCLTSFKIQTSSVVVRRDILLNNQIAFPKDKRYGQDTYVWLELARKYPLLSIDKPLTKFRIRSNNAGFRAHVQLQARSQMYMDIKNNKTSLKLNKIPLLIRWNYMICVFLNNLLAIIKKSGLKKESYLEMISKILYGPNWLVFKILSKLYL